MSLRAASSLLILLLAGACSAQANMSLNVPEDEEDKVKDFDTPLEGRQYSEQDEESEVEDELALLGARQDLSFNGPPTTKCKCLGVVVGQSPNPGFAWESRTPRSDPDKQLVVAVEAASCADEDPGGGVSYRGYRVDGDNVVVQIERAHPGRPLTAGAIIPKPFDSGSVFIEASKGMATGQALTGDGMCNVGNPGPKRIRSEEQPVPVQSKDMATRRLGRPRMERETGDPEVPAVSAQPEDKR